MKNNISKYKNHCCGCSVCYEICPKSAITLKNNSQGFIYPTVDSKKCIGCGLCLEYCVFNNTSKNISTAEQSHVFALKHQSNSVRTHSQSGGAFTAISDFVLSNGGVVYGCELINFRDAIHVRATTKEERDRQRMSKYIQSDIKGILKPIKDDLLANKIVLFSGTPCQVASIKSFLKNFNTEKLILVDIICNGVGSPKFWADYLDSMRKQYHGNITGAIFRNKEDLGWNSHVESIWIDGEKHDSTFFKMMFNTHLIARKDCSNCIYKSTNRIGDITIGDCWGGQKEYPDFSDSNGVSLVIGNNPKGMNILRSLSKIDLISSKSQVLLQQPSLNRNWMLPNKYLDFWHFYEKHGFEKTMQRYKAYAESILYKDEELTLFKRFLGKCGKIIKRSQPK